MFEQDRAGDIIAPAWKTGFEQSAALDMDEMEQVSPYCKISLEMLRNIDVVYVSKGPYSQGNAFMWVDSVLMMLSGYSLS